jgi:hypothetical protein
MDSAISRPRTWSAAGKLNVAGLVAAAAGIAIQIASGADYPTVPPGLILVLAAAGWSPAWPRPGEATGTGPTHEQPAGEPANQRPAVWHHRQRAGTIPSPFALRGMPQPWRVRGVMATVPPTWAGQPVVLEGVRQ